MKVYKLDEYRIDTENLLKTLSIWNSYLQKKVHLIACGGTALTLLAIKESTKDIDLIVPEESEYIYLVKILKELGYKQITQYGWKKDDGFIFDLYPGNNIYTTGLLESPLEDRNNLKYKEFSSIYLGILNYYDLIISKIFRCSSVDIQDCKALFKAKHEEIDIERLKKRFFKTSSYDISDDKNKRNFKHFLRILNKEGYKI